jgi:gluconate 2-dehydrogenase gamma chain
MWKFFRPEEAAAVEAMSARIIPSEPGSPGAREAGAVRYIDEALAEASPDLGRLYRDGAAHLNELSHSRCGRVFADLGPAEQDVLLASLDQAPDGEVRDAAGGEQAGILGRLFAVVWEHTIQGVFGDPMYGGNQDCVGWKLIGVPGAQWGYDAGQMRPGFDAATIPVQTLGQLRQQSSAAGDGGPGAGPRGGA